jgi:hypothetical protein
MTGEALKEFKRRLQAEGYENGLDELGAGAVRDGEQTIFITDDGEIRFKPENRAFAYRVRDIRDEVDEYMTEFLSADPNKAQFRGGGRSDTRTLAEYNGCELAARRLPDGDMDFVTWRIGKDNSREIGHYIGDYAEAKRDFAVRSGLIDRNRLFSETELSVIRSNLSDFLAIDGGDHITAENEQTVRGVIRKIDTVVVPEIREQAQEAEDMGYEPEYEM